MGESVLEAAPTDAGIPEVKLWGLLITFDHQPQSGLHQLSQAPSISRGERTGTLEEGVGYLDRGLHISLYIQGGLDDVKADLAIRVVPSEAEATTQGPPLLDVRR